MLQKVLGITLVVFMVGNLLEMGLKLRLDAAREALRNGRFVGLSLLWAFVLCPALAVLLTKLIPLAAPYALGLLLVGMAPSAPFLPVMAQRAGGDLAYVAAFMVLAAAGTVVFMPFAVPILATGFTADAWTIAKPLLLYVAAPMALGVAARRCSKTFAELAHPLVRKVTAVATVILLALIFRIYGRDFLGAVGSYAIGTLILYGAIVTTAAYKLGFGLPASRKSVLSLGLCTRNVGAAVAPLMAVPGTDQRAIVMCCLAMVVSVVEGLVAAAVIARSSAGGATVSVRGAD